ncbi:hypothetical protein RQP46_002091 [Phenoliferia psychrophenolica]
MVRLDAELLARVPSQLNCLKDRELDLRGHKIPAIENLGVTRDSLDALDLTDNSITSLSNFPLLRRLAHVYLSSNPLRTISPSVPTSLPNLRTLVLTNCALPKESLGSVGEVLGRCKRLEQLSLKGCPVAEAQYYREWIVFKCKGLRSLDFDRIKDKDRAAAKALFLTPDGAPTPLSVSFTTAASTAAASAASALNGVSKTFEPGVEAAVASGKAGRLLSKEEKDRVRSAIEGAESVEEIRRLQRMLAQGPTEKDLKDLEKKKKGGAAPDAMDQD